MNLDELKDFLLKKLDENKIEDLKVKNIVTTLRSGTPYNYPYDQFEGYDFY